MTTESLALACNLLNASLAAYDIKEAGTLPLTNPAVAKAGFTHPPKTFVGGPGVPIPINACLVGTAGNSVIVAFRGTLAPTRIFSDWSQLLDWLQDLLADTKVVAGFPGEIHQGFADAFATLWPSAGAEVTQQMSAIGAGARLLITGHSKGGPLANYAAWSAAQPPTSGSPVCITFASPKPGDKKFARAYDGQPRISDTRFEYQDDFVPHLAPGDVLFEALNQIPDLPPALKKLLQDAASWNYQPVGTLQFINWSNQIVSPTGFIDKTKLEIERLASLVRLLVELKFRKIADDHSLKGGYCANICPPGTCT